MVKGTYGDAYDYPSNAVIPVEFPLTDNYPFAMGVVDWIHTFSPSFVNEFRAGYSRIVSDTETSDPSGDFGTNGDTLMGIGYPGTQPLPGFTYMHYIIQTPTASAPHYRRQQDHRQQLRLRG